MTGLHVISADSHVQEPPDLYERLPRAMRDRAPRKVERDGKTYIVVDGRKPRRIDLAESRATADDQNREFRNDPSGGRDLEVRLTDLKRDGITAEVIYPNQSLALYMSPEPAYQMAVAQAYNDWAAEHFRPHRTRFAPVGMVPVSDIGAASAGGRAYGQARLPVDQGADHASHAALQPPRVRAAVGGD